MKFDCVAVSDCIFRQFQNSRSQALIQNEYRKWRQVIKFPLTDSVFYIRTYVMLASSLHSTRIKFEGTIPRNVTVAQASRCLAESSVHYTPTPFPKSLKHLTDQYSVTTKMNVLCTEVPQLVCCLPQRRHWCWDHTLSLFISVKDTLRVGESRQSVKLTTHLHYVTSFYCVHADTFTVHVMSTHFTV